MDIEAALQWLQNTAVGTMIRKNEILFPWIESVHVLAIVLVVGTISIVDLRLIGVASLDRAANRLMRDVLPYTWGAFAVAATTGTLLFTSNATTYGHNFFFLGKMILLVFAGLNMAIFHFNGIRGVEHWGASRQTPLAAKAAGAVSLLIWVFVIVFGRWIGFTLN